MNIYYPGLKKYPYIIDFRSYTRYLLHNPIKILKNLKQSFFNIRLSRKVDEILICDSRRRQVWLIIENKLEKFMNDDSQQQRGKYRFEGLIFTTS